MEQLISPNEPTSNRLVVAVEENPEYRGNSIITHGKGQNRYEWAGVRRVGVFRRICGRNAAINESVEVVKLSEKQPEVINLVTEALNPVIDLPEVINEVKDNIEVAPLSKKSKLKINGEAIVFSGSCFLSGYVASIEYLIKYTQNLSKAEFIATVIASGLLATGIGAGIRGAHRWMYAHREYPGKTREELEAKFSK